MKLYLKIQHCHNVVNIYMYIYVRLFSAYIVKLRTKQQIQGY